MSYNFNDADQREAAMAAKWAECCEENTFLRQQLAELQARINNLLCIIHRGGGHYIAEHGDEKAYVDAEALLHKWKFAASGKRSEMTYESWRITYQDYETKQQLAALKPAAKIIRNSAGQICIFAMNGDPFDMSKYVGATLYATIKEELK